MDMHMTYNLEYFPAARKDMLDIVKYTSDNLSNPDAASRLADELIEKIEALSEMPYVNTAYTPIRSLNHEYRKAIVNKYILLGG